MALNLYMFLTIIFFCAISEKIVSSEEQTNEDNEMLDVFVKKTLRDKLQQDLVLKYIQKELSNTIPPEYLQDLISAWENAFNKTNYAFQKEDSNTCEQVSQSNSTFLTERQQQLMKENIALIATDLSTHAMNIFIDMFTARPDFRVLFKKIQQDLPLDQLREDPFLKQHSSRILLALANVITDFMHDPVALSTKFIDVAEHHIPRNVNHTHLVVLKGVVLNYLKKTLTEAMPPQDLRDLLCTWERILNKAYDAFYDVNTNSCSPVTPNNTTFLTDRQQQLMKDNIALIASDLPTHAMNIFINMFTARPDFRVLFKKIQQVLPLDQLREDPFLNQHSSRILLTLANVITDFMHDPVALSTKFIDVAEHHIPRNVNHTHLVVLKGVVLNYLKTALTGVMETQDLRDLLCTWERILDKAYDAFQEVNTNNCSPVAPNNTTFLTDRQQQLMKDNIALIASDLSTHAMNIFIDMFTTRPDFRMLFKKIQQDISIDQLREDPFLKQHSSRILLTLANVISDLMHDPVALSTKFIDVAEHHIPRNVNHTHLVVLKGVVLNYLKTSLTGAMLPQDLRDLLCAWEIILNKAYDAFYEVNTSSTTISTPIASSTVNLTSEITTLNVSEPGNVSLIMPVVVNTTTTATETKTAALKTTITTKSFPQTTLHQPVTTAPSIQQQKSVKGSPPCIRRRFGFKIFFG